ncbi:hypothetical protein [Mycobacterium avium]|uniref:hypothetical protein n=1 Tax=Mycobacterium avium TaxID=1764 RepID=UPI000CE33160|nr:hypothetical protein [Mycobacterium avium]MBZ4574699.1 hypothetical protein [Mycobacterium avium subsp. hominissuis]
MAYRVTCPLVVAKDREGRNHHCYQGAIIHWLGDEQRDRWLRLGLVEEIPDTAPAPAGGEPAAVPSGSVKPAKTAPLSAWVEYGVHNGHDRAELEALSKQELQELLG